MTNREFSNELGAAVFKTVLANLIVFVLSATVVRIFGLSSQSDPIALVILLLVATVAVALVSRSLLPGAGSAVFVNVVATIFANSIVFFVPPVNEWVRAFTYIGAVAIVVSLLPALLIALFVSFGEGRNGCPGGCIIAVAIPVWLAMSGLFLYGGFAQPGSSMPEGFAFSIGFKMIQQHLLPTVFVTIALIFTFLLIFGICMGISPKKANGDFFGAAVILALVIALAAIIWLTGWVVPWAVIFSWLPPGRPLIVLEW